MNRVTLHLLIGSRRDTRDDVLLRYHGVTAMVQLAASVDHDGIAALYLPADDGVPNKPTVLASAVAFIRYEYAWGNSTLVACGLSVSRSATVATAAVREIEQVSLESALHAVRSLHPETRAHSVLWRCLGERYGELVPYLTVNRKRSGSAFP